MNPGKLACLIVFAPIMATAALWLLGHLLTASRG